MNIYSEKETGEVLGTLGERVVSKLMETIRGKNVMFAFDRFLPSVHLMETPKFPAGGKCIKTRKDVPNFATKLSKRGEAEFLVTKNGTRSLDGVRKAQRKYQRRRGTGRPSKTSRSLLNVGDHLPVTTKNTTSVP
ncbi:piggyBac transposable element-derived protein 4 [Trichonephila clavipes]|nr:piggyBac transposable element-derived protein 4 [Trichonephila clavipes]